MRGGAPMKKTEKRHKKNDSGIKGVFHREFTKN